MHDIPPLHLISHVAKNCEGSFTVHMHGNVLTLLFEADPTGGVPALSGILGSNLSSDEEKRIRVRCTAKKGGFVEFFPPFAFKLQFGPMPAVSFSVLAYKHVNGLSGVNMAGTSKIKRNTQMRALMKRPERAWCCQYKRPQVCKTCFPNACECEPADSDSEEEDDD
jgi:hypothetical protein